MMREHGAMMQTAETRVPDACLIVLIVYLSICLFVYHLIRVGLLTYRECVSRIASAIIGSFRHFVRLIGLELCTWQRALDIGHWALADGLDHG